MNDGTRAVFRSGGTVICVTQVLQLFQRRTWDAPALPKDLRGVLRLFRRTWGAVPNNPRVVCRISPSSKKDYQDYMTMVNIRWQVDSKSTTTNLFSPASIMFYYQFLSTKIPTPKDEKCIVRKQQCPRNVSYPIFLVKKSHTLLTCTYNFLSINIKMLLRWRPKRRFS